MRKQKETTTARRRSGPSDNVIVDPEFQALIPPLTAAELASLHASLDIDGCVEPLLVWKGHNLLIDGHNRLVYCRSNRIPFKVREKAFPDREAVKDAIIRIQRGRRNLSDLAERYLRGKQYLASKHQGKRTSEASGQVDQKTTAERLGEDFQAGEKTIRRDAKLAQAIDEIVANCGEEARNFFLARDSGVTRSCVRLLVERTPKEQKKFVADMKKNDGKVQPTKREKGQKRKMSMLREPEAIVQTLLKTLNAEELGKVVAGLSDCATPVQ